SSITSGVLNSPISVIIQEITSVSSLIVTGGTCSVAASDNSCAAKFTCSSFDNQASGSLEFYSVEMTLSAASLNLADISTVDSMKFTLGGSADFGNLATTTGSTGTVTIIQSNTNSTLDIASIDSFGAVSITTNGTTFTLDGDVLTENGDVSISASLATVTLYNITSAEDITLYGFDINQKTNSIFSALQGRFDAACGGIFYAESGAAINSPIISIITQSTIVVEGVYSGVTDLTLSAGSDGNISLGGNLDLQNLTTLALGGNVITVEGISGDSIDMVVNSSQFIQNGNLSVNSLGVSVSNHIVIDGTIDANLDCSLVSSSNDDSSIRVLVNKDISASSITISSVYSQVLGDLIGCTNTSSIDTCGIVSITSSSTQPFLLDCVDIIGYEISIDVGGAIEPYTAVTTCSNSIISKMGDITVDAVDDISLLQNIVTSADRITMTATGQCVFGNDCVYTAASDIDIQCESLTIGGSSSSITSSQGLILLDLTSGAMSAPYTSVSAFTTMTVKTLNQPIEGYRFESGGNMILNAGSQVFTSA
ncbi:hypothetical protein ADUPG1_010760, partial [Aduncisulcus paluster]